MPAFLPSFPPPTEFLPYQAADPRRRAQALVSARQALAQHFPGLSEEEYRWALQALQPPLYVLGAEAVYLDYLDLTHLVQYLSYVASQAHLDPPIYGHAAYYLARQLCFFSREAERAQTELEALSPALTGQLRALITRLASGNGVAEQVLAAHAWRPGELPSAPDVAVDSCLPPSPAADA